MDVSKGMREAMLRVLDLSAFNTGGAIVMREVSSDEAEDEDKGVAEDMKEAVPSTGALRK